MNGLFREGKFIYGKLELKDGTIFKGSLENMEKNGKGILRYSNGDHYDGYFLHDKFNGEGVLISK